MPVVGRFSDRLGKKLFLWLGLLIYAIAAVGYVWSPSYHELVLFRVISGVGAAMTIPTAFAYVGELAPHGREGRYMGLFNIALIAGFGIGPMLGGTVHDNFGMDDAVASMAVLSTLGFVIVILLLPGNPASSRATSLSTELEVPSNPFLSILRDTTMQGVVVFMWSYGLLFGTVLAFVGIWMTTVIETSVAQVGIVLSVRAILNGTLAYPFGWLGDRTNRVVLASVGMVMIAIGTSSIPSMGSFTMLLGLFVIMGIFESMVFPSINVITVGRGRSLGMGSVMGIFNTAMSLGLITGSMAGGAIENSRSIVEVFHSAAVFGLVGIVIFNVFMLRNARST